MAPPFSRTMCEECSRSGILLCPPHRPRRNGRQRMQLENNRRSTLIDKLSDTHVRASHDSITLLSCWWFLSHFLKPIVPLRVLVRRRIRKFCILITYYSMAEQARYVCIRTIQFLLSNRVWGRSTRHLGTAWPKCQESRSTLIRRRISGGQWFCGGIPLYERWRDPEWSWLLGLELYYPSELRYGPGARSLSNCKFRRICMPNCGSIKYNSGCSL